MKKENKTDRELKTLLREQIDESKRKRRHDKFLISSGVLSYNNSESNNKAVPDESIKTLLENGRIIELSNGFFVPNKSLNDVIDYYLDANLPISETYINLYFRKEDGSKFTAARKTISKKIQDRKKYIE